MKFNKVIVRLMLVISLFMINANIVFAKCTEGNGKYCNISTNTVQCGNGLIDNIPTLLPKVVSIIYIVIQIAVPVALVIFGLLDLFKGIAAQKEDEIKKGQQTLIKRVIAAVLVFFVFAIVKFVISLVADGDKVALFDCAQCFIENKCGVK